MALYPRDDSSRAVSPNVDLPAMEQETIARWISEDTFRRSVAQREGNEEWVFYDGPPFANGLPHYGHLLTGYAKDIFPRFQTMRGKQVHRRFGWDTHGLPAELEAERQLGITDKSQIEQMGIAAFNAAARDSVLRYTEEWREYVTRQARWVDFDNDYKTLDTGFMESSIWAFKQLFDKGLAYEGYRVLPYCWRDQTPLSNHELRMDDDVYKDVQDLSVTVTFPLTGERAASLKLDGVAALAWTTTPWTLPTNSALAVGPAIEYAVVPHAETAQRFLLASELAGSYFKELGYVDAGGVEEAIERRLVGSELVGLQYKPLFDYYLNHPANQKAFVVYAGEYVTTTDGTGIVHQAPAYGEEDQLLANEHGIGVVLSLDDAGVFLPEVHDFAGRLWRDANIEIARHLRSTGRLFREASYVHSYPHCWRCRNPLIYRAVSSWFVRVTEFKDRMVELNEQIEWVPDNVKHGQFGKWLEGARDWSISRNRYWGSPIPVWKSDNDAYPRIDVYGSLEELERDFGALPRNENGEVDLHRPFIDDLVRPNPDDPSGSSMMRRIPDVLDVWFDSGSMPFAQVHYPFENREWFDSHNPADFIVEYIGQTRGWFYTMHVLATALFDRPAYKRVIAHGIVLGNDGQKMSKSLRNYPDVAEAFAREGSDAMRWFLMSSPVLRGGNLIVTEEGIREGMRQFLLPLWNTWYFFSLYANASGYSAKFSTEATHVLDRYLLAKTRGLIEDVTEALEQLDSPAACLALREFGDVLTNWYVRRNRDRFWEGTERNPDHSQAFDTLFTVLETVTRLAAPLLPLTAENVWRGLTGGDSVHLTDWPEATIFPQDLELVRSMDGIREITSTALALRKAAHLRVRLPLPALTVIVDQPEILTVFADILRDELNVRELIILQLDAEVAQRYGLVKRLTVHARIAGPRLGGSVQRAIFAAKNGDWKEENGTVWAGDLELQPGEYEIELSAGDDTSHTAIAVLKDGGFLILDTSTTPELLEEGLARDAIRQIQEARRQAGLDVSDRISVEISATKDVVAAIDAHRDLVSAETLSVNIVTRVSDASDGVELAGGGRLSVSLERV